VKQCNIKLIHWAGASSDSGVVDDGNFWQFRWLLLWQR